MDISVVVPVYNAEKYLSRFMESVLAQTHKNFEVILVDDGSKDKSGEICDEYANKDSRIKVIHKKNEGTGFARNDGQAAAQGEYIYFCDPDDLLYPTLLEDNFGLAKKYGADLAVFGSECLKETCGGLVPDYVSVPELEGAFDFKAFWNNFEKEFKVVTAVWNRMFRREFLEKNGIKSGNLSTGQDAVFLYDVYAAPLKCVVYNKGIYYKYIVHERSATTGFKSERFENIFKCTKKLEEMLRKSEGAKGRYAYLADEEYVNAINWGIRAVCGASGIGVFEVSRILKSYMEKEEVKRAFDRLNFVRIKGFKKKVRLFLIKHKCFAAFIAATRLHRTVFGEK